MTLCFLTPGPTPFSHSRFCQPEAQLELCPRPPPHPLLQVSHRGAASGWRCAVHCATSAPVGVRPHQRLLRGRVVWTAAGSQTAAQVLSSGHQVTYVPTTSTRAHNPAHTCTRGDATPPPPDPPTILRISQVSNPTPSQGASHIRVASPTHGVTHAGKKSQCVARNSSNMRRRTTGWRRPGPQGPRARADRPGRRMGSPAPRQYLAGEAQDTRQEGMLMGRAGWALQAGCWHGQCVPPIFPER